MANLVLTEVCKTYPGGVEAIKGINLNVADGQLCVLVGPSGCGKSTLLRMIAGLETTTSGSIQIGGQTVNDVEPAKRDIAMVFQNYALYPHMSVYNNMAYGLRNRGMAEDQIKARVNDAAQILEIGTMLERKPRQLSGGQRQRVAMGRAIVRQPKVFLFDEPLSNLDAKLRIAMRIEIRKLQRRLKTTSVYVTHDQLEAMTLADVLVVMNAGVVEQIGKPIDLYRRPLTSFVASFIGAPPMNLFQIGRIWRAMPKGLPGNVGIVGVRPEDLALTATRTEGDLSLELTVDAIEQIGAETFIYGSATGTGEVMVRVPGEEAPPLGSTIRASAPRSKLHLFTADGRIRIEL